MATVATGTLCTIDISTGAQRAPYSARLEQYGSTSGGVRRKYLVFDKVTPISTTDTSHTVDFAFDLLLPTGTIVDGSISTGYTAKTGLKFKIVWFVDGLSTGNVLWGVKGETITANSTAVYTDTFGTATTQATAVPTVANGYTTTTISVVKANLGSGSPSAGDLLRMVLYRDATSASDTTSAVAKVVSIEVIDY